MLLRELHRSDREPLIEILRATGLFSGEEIVVAKELIDAGLGLGPGDGYLFVVAEDENAVAGYACWGTTPMTVGTWDLYWIAVHPRTQGRGIGRALLRHVEDAVRASSGRLLLVETSGRPDYAPTRAFYERTGYPEIARIPDFYRNGDDKVIHARRLG